jgi:hypothetical protein
VVALVSGIKAQINPCQDSLYLALKSKDLNTLSDREYEYLMLYTKKCLETGQQKNMETTPHSESVEKETNIKKQPDEVLLEPVECAGVIVVRPKIDKAILTNDVDDDNLISGGNAIATTIESTYKSAKIISEVEVKNYRKCNSSLVIIKFIGLHKEAAKLGQFTYVINLSVTFYDLEKYMRIIRSKDFKATGERDWGNERPFLNAINRVCKDIKDYLEHE